MKTLFTIITAIALFALNINAQNIPWSTDYSGGECTLSMPEWDGFVGSSSHDDGFIHSVSLNSGEDGYDGQILPNQAKVVRVLMAPGVETIQVTGTWAHSFSGVTLHGFLHGDTNQVGGFTANFEPGQVCENGCTSPYIDTTELYLYPSFLDDQRTITRAELNIPITQPIWVSYVMYQKHDSYINENISLTFSCNVIGSTNVQVYRDWLVKRPWYTTPGTDSTDDGVFEWHDIPPTDPCEDYVPGEISGPIQIAPSSDINISSLQDASGSDNITYNWYVWGMNGYGNENQPVSGEAGSTIIHTAPDMDFVNNEGGLFFINFRRESVAGCGYDETETIVVKVYSDAPSCDVDLTPGTINKTELTFCDSTAPGEFQSLVAAVGSGNITYQWEASTDLGTTWVNVDGQTSETADYTTPINLGLTETSDPVYYQIRRRAFDDCDNSFEESNVITLTYTYCPPSCDVELSPGTINKTLLTHCDSTAPGEFQSLVAAIGTGNITYQWEQSTDLGTTWTDIDGQTSETADYSTSINLGLTGTSDDVYYQIRRKAFDDCDNSFDESNVITLTYTYCGENNVNAITKSTLKLYPNPAHNTITIDGTVQGQSITVYDIMGKELLNTNNLTINISNFDRGVYFVKVENKIIKFIKE